MSRQLRQKDISTNGKAKSHSEKGLKLSTRNNTKRIQHKLKLTHKAASTPVVDDSDERHDIGTDGDDENTTDTDEEDGIAPSGGPYQRRGHKTGLSVSLSNTSIGEPNRKRSWSNRAREEDTMTRPNKLSRAERSTAAVEDDTNDAEDSDTGYEGIDLISESEDEDTERDEEQLIIESEEENNESDSSSESSSDCEDDTMAEETNFFEEQFENTPGAGESAVKSERRVRFADELESSSEEDEGYLDDFFPDLFLEQDRLDPRFMKAMLERGSDDEGSLWEFDHGERTAKEEDEEQYLDDEEFSGFESDEGETTDEDVVTPATIRPSSSQTTPAKTPASTPKKAVQRFPVTPYGSARHQGPSLASWTVDTKKPYSTVDGSGKRILYYDAQKSQGRPSSANATLANSPNSSPTRSNFLHENGQDLDLTNFSLFPWRDAESINNHEEDEEYDDENDFEDDIKVFGMYTVGEDSDVNSGEDSGVESGKKAGPEEDDEQEVLATSAEERKAEQEEEEEASIKGCNALSTAAAFRHNRLKIQRRNSSSHAHSTASTSKTSIR